jgi:diaminopimelate decarboxylase
MILNRGDIARLTSGLKAPFYLYDLDGLRSRAEMFKSVLPAGAHCHFAMKANNNAKVLVVLRECGFGIDAVSSGEIQRALHEEFLASNIIFSGVGKTADEIHLALKWDIDQINVESVEELKRIAAIARETKTKARVALRMNPDVDVNTHPYIRTGFRDNKFGLDFGAVPEILEILKREPKFVELQGLTLHIGSQIRDVEPFTLAIRKTLFAPVLKSKIVEKLYLEPGRIIIARFGFLVSEVQYVKRTPFKNFVIIDTGMHHLIRPALYEAHHRIERLSAPKLNSSTEIFDVVGPICESADVLGCERVLPADIASGDRVMIHDVGAYGAVMASRYNLRDEAREYTIKEGVLSR